MQATRNSRRAECCKHGGCYLKFFLQKGSFKNFAFLCERMWVTILRLKKKGGGRGQRWKNVKTAKYFMVGLMFMNSSGKNWLHLPGVCKRNLSCKNMSESPKKVRYGGYTELFNTEFVQNIILVKGMLVQIQNYKILSFPGIPFWVVFLLNLKFVEFFQKCLKWVSLYT